jgi:cytochrome c biogenesis protein
MTLIASLLTIAGLVTSLLVRRRRVFVRAQPDPSDPSTTLVTIGGLSKTADPGLAAVLDGLVAELSGRSPGAALAAHPERT